MAAVEKSPSPVASDEEKNVLPTKGTPPNVDEMPSAGIGDAFEGYVIDKDVEKRVLRKCDLIILPTLAIMYLMKYVHLTSENYIVQPLTCAQLYRQKQSGQREDRHS